MAFPKKFLLDAAIRACRDLRSPVEKSKGSRSSMAQRLVVL